MHIGDVRLLYDYNYWANRQLLAASTQASSAQFINATAHSIGSLRGTLVHILDAECAWRMLYQHQTLAYFRAMKEDAFPAIDVLKQRWNEDERAMRDYLVSLGDNDLSGVIRYTTLEGDKRERVLWHCLLHVVNHGTQHRSEAAVMLTEWGYSPRPLDFTAFLNEQ